MTTSFRPKPCTDRPVIARNDQGEAVARREPPTCHGETWVIEE